MTAPALDERLRLNVKEASSAYGRHEVTLRRALVKGELHGSQRGKNGRWSLRRECIEAWLDGEQCPHGKGEEA